MPRDFAFRRWLASMSIVLALLMADCAALKNTPAQDEAWSRWAACRSQVTGSDIRIVQLDGRITFWSNGADDGRSTSSAVRPPIKGAGRTSASRTDLLYQAE